MQSLLHPQTLKYLVAGAIVAIGAFLIVRADLKAEKEISVKFLSSTAFNNIFPVLLLLLAFSPFMFRTATTFGLPAEHTYPESTIAEGINRVIEGQNLYQDFAQQPFAIMPYPPLYYYFAARFKGSDDSYSVNRMLPGRSLTLAAFLVLLILIRQFGAGPFLAKDLAAETHSTKLFCRGELWAVILLGSAPIFLRWALTCRPDLLALLFSILGIMAIYRSPNLGLWLALILFWLAVFTKHSYISAPVAVCLWLMIRKQYLRLVIFGGAFAVGGILLFYLGNSMTDGLMKKNMFSVVDVPYSIKAFMFVIPRTIRDFFFILVIGGFALWLTRKTFWKSLIGIYFLVSLLLATLASTKVGSSRNYYFESATALSLLSAPCIDYWIGKFDHRHRFSIYATMTAIALLLFLNSLSRIERWREFDTNTPLLADYIGDIYHDDQTSPPSMLSSFGHFAIHGPRPVLVLDPFLLNKAQYSENWDEQPLVDRINSKSVGCLVMGFDLNQPPDAFQGFSMWSEKVLRAMKDNYYLAHFETDKHIYFYRPNKL